MLSPLVPASRLVTGARLTLEEFLREWEAQPEVKQAELIEGIVYMPSPVSRDHGRQHATVIAWLWQYAQATPGCECGDNATWIMLESSPQPDAFLRVLPESGGRSRNEKNYLAGAPELIVEVCLTSTEVDFGPKLALYQRAGVQEYITIELFAKRIIWRVLIEGSYAQLQPHPDGVLRSRRFPGLWFDADAFWSEDGGRLIATLMAGLVIDEHARFAAGLGASQ
jgi:Uma2 family endonuclease